MVSICTGLLHERNARDVEMALRVGDCYALLIEFYYSSTPQKQPNWTAAYELIQEMKHRKIGLDPYLEKDMIHEIYRKTGHGHIGLVCVEPSHGLSQIQGFGAPYVSQ